MTEKMKVRSMKNIYVYQANTNENKAGVAI